MKGTLYFLKRISFAVLDIEEGSYKIDVHGWVEYKAIDDEYSTHEFILRNMGMEFIEGDEDDFSGLDAFYDFAADMVLNEAENFIAENPDFMCEMCLGDEKGKAFVLN